MEQFLYSPLDAFMKCSETISRFTVVYIYIYMGTAVAQRLRCCATNRKVSGDIKSFRSHYGPGADSASNRNEYQEYFLGVKAAGA